LTHAVYFDNEDKLTGKKILLKNPSARIFPIKALINWLTALRMSAWSYQFRFWKVRRSAFI